MKRVTLAVAVASALLAGPDIDRLVDYDKQDQNIAKAQESAQIAPPPVVAPVVTKPEPVAPVMKRANCCTNRDSIDLIGGYNFTEDDGALDDAALAGIRYNKNIAPNTYIQIGYDRVFNADYKNRVKNYRNRSRSVSGGGYDTGGSSGNGSGGYSGLTSGTNNENGYNSSNYSNSTNGTGDTSGYNNSSTYLSSINPSSTQLDRFYLNGLYEFCNEKRLMPYLFAGFGYENVRHESYNLKSGGFFNAGGGLKYQINEDINFLTEAKALKRFDNHDLDIMATVGLGFMLGEIADEEIVENELQDSLEPKPETIPSIIPADAPLATMEEPKVPYSYDDSKDYENFDVVPIDEKVDNGYIAKDSYQDIEPAYYIQIAALFNENSTGSSYIDKLDKLGLNHKIKETTVRGKPIKLLLAGPYSSRSEAKADLNIAKRVEKGAFIKKLDG